MEGTSLAVRATFALTKDFPDRGLSHPWTLPPFHMMRCKRAICFTRAAVFSAMVLTRSISCTSMSRSPSVTLTRTAARCVSAAASVTSREWTRIQAPSSVPSCRRIHPMTSTGSWYTYSESFQVITLGTCGHSSTRRKVCQYFPIAKQLPV